MDYFISLHGVTEEPVLGVVCHEKALTNKTRTACFMRCRHILKTVKKVTDRLPVLTETVYFLPADF